MRHIILLLLLLITSGSLMSQSNITSMTLSPSTPTDCDSTYLTVYVTNSCANYIYNGSTVNVSGNNISVDINYIVGIFCLPAILNTSHTINLGVLNAGTVNISAATYLNATQSSTSSLNNVMVTSCCGADASFTPVEDTICLGDTLTVSNSTTGQDSVHWYASNNLVDTAYTPNLVFNTSGSIDLMLVAYGDTCNDTAISVITVMPEPTVNLGPDTTICFGSSLNLNVSGSFTSYFWSDGGTTSSNSIDTIATKWVEATTNFGCVGSDTVSVTGILGLSNVDIGSDTTICPGDTAEITLGTGYIFTQWSTGATTPFINVTMPGTYWVEAQESELCSTRDSVVVSHFSLDTFSLQGDSNQCDSNVIRLNTTFSNYLWSTGSTSSTTTIYDSATVNVTVTDANSCKQTDSGAFEVYDSPVVYLGADTNLCGVQSLTLSTGIQSGTFEWSNNTFDSTLAVTSKGTYWVKVTSEDGCVGSDTIVVKKCVGIDEHYEAFNLYPNPVSSTLTVELSSAWIGGDAWLFDIEGRRIDAWVIASERSSFDVSKLPSGHYVMRLTDDHGTTQTVPLIIE